MRHSGLVDLRLASVTFTQIIEQYDEVEEWAQAASFLAFADKLTDCQYVAKTAVVAGDHYFLKCDTSPNGREMIIELIPVVKTRSQPVPLSEVIDEVGMIRRIVVTCPKKAAAVAGRALADAATALRGNYRILERRFLELYREHTRELLADIEPIVFACFDQNHLPVLASECRLSVTPLKRGKYCLYFGPEQVRTILERFKGAQHQEGALELVITLITDEGRDGFLTRNALLQDEVALFSFAELASTHDNLGLVHAENLLFPGRSLGCIELCRFHDLSLQANMAGRHAAAAKAPLLAMQEKIAEQFTLNVRRAGWQRATLALSWKARKVRKTITIQDVRDELRKLAVELVGNALGLPPRPWR